MMAIVRDCTMIIFVEQLIVCQSKTDINFALKSLGFLLVHGGAMRLHSYKSHTALLANTSPVYINACNHFSTLLLRLVSSTPFGFIYQFCAKGQLISKCPFGFIIWTKIPTKKFDKFFPTYSRAEFRFCQKFSLLKPRQTKIGFHFKCQKLNWWERVTENAKKGGWK